MAEAVLPVIPAATPATITAVALQFGSTNVHWSRLTELWRCLIQRASEVAGTCSLQQLADLAWMFHRVQLPDDMLQSFKATHTQALRALLTHHQQQRYSKASVSTPAGRHLVCEAANALSRLTQARYIAQDGPEAISMLTIVMHGADEVCASGLCMLVTPRSCVVSIHHHVCKNRSVNC